MKKTFKATGLVYGNYWGGDGGSYPSNPLKGETKESIIKQATKGIEDGSLDAGMGFESLVGALICIETIETIEINGKDFSHREYKTVFVGDLTESEQDFLDEVWCHTV